MVFVYSCGKVGQSALPQERQAVLRIANQGLSGVLEGSPIMLGRQAADLEELEAPSACEEKSGLQRQLQPTASKSAPARRLRRQETVAVRRQ